MERIPEKETMEEISELFKAFADPTRVHILMLLEQRQELCVGDLTEAVGLTQSAVSHQLRVLKASKLVKFRREGKVVFYSLADDHVSRILSQGMEHIEE